MSALVNDTPTSPELTSAMATTRKAHVMGGMSDVMVNTAATTLTNIMPPPMPQDISVKTNTNQGLANVGEQYRNHFPMTSDPQQRRQRGASSNCNEDSNLIDMGPPGLEPIPDMTPEHMALEPPKIRLTPTIKLLATPNPIDPKRKFVCPYENCTKSYGKSSHLRSHLTWHTGMKPFVCQSPNCGKGFTRSDELNRHVRTHTGEKPFECVQCSKKFSRSDHLTKHLATHSKHQALTNGQTYNKRTRQQPNEEPDNKKVYVEMKSPNQPVHFNDGMHFMATLAGNMPLPMKQEDYENSSLPPPPLQRAPLKIKLERPENSDNYQIVRPTLPPPPSISITANRSGIAVPSLNRSITSSESEEDIATELIVPVSTMVCPPSPVIKTEPSDEAFTPEMSIAARPGVDTSAAYDIPNFGHFMAEVSPSHDTETRPFHCGQCTKSFKRQDDLNRHVRTHTGEKPYACTQCERRFMRKDHLKKHMNTHRQQR